VFKNIARSFALVLFLALAAAPAASLHAQSVVSGGDPEPTGEPDTVQIITIAALVALAVS
jgi:hypothetical protein